MLRKKCKINSNKYKKKYNKIKCLSRNGTVFGVRCKEQLTLMSLALLKWEFTCKIVIRQVALTQNCLFVGKLWRIIISVSENVVDARLHRIWHLLSLKEKAQVQYRLKVTSKSNFNIFVPSLILLDQKEKKKNVRWKFRFFAWFYFNFH